MNNSFWNDYAQAMELSVEGNKLIAQEIGRFFRNANVAVKAWFGDALRSYVATSRPPQI